MGRTAKAVKPTRRYDASGRRERALRQHAATLDAAQHLFLANGYAATTVEAIADEAGVSAATIYKSYGGKAGLVRELCRRALEGEGPIPAEARSDALRTGDDPRAIVEGWGRLVAEVSPRGAPLMLLLRTAATGDAEAAALYAELDASRLARMHDNARHLARAGLRDGVRVSDARDVMWFCTAPELYDLLVNRRRWSISKFSRFVTDLMVSSLVP